jgi:hypothetical protein
VAKERSHPPPAAATPTFGHPPSRPRCASGTLIGSTDGPAHPTPCPEMLLWPAGERPGPATVWCFNGSVSDRKEWSRIIVMIMCPS